MMNIAFVLNVSEEKTVLNRRKKKKKKEEGEIILQNFERNVNRR